MTNVQQVQNVLSSLAKMLPPAQAAETAADQAWLTWMQQNEGPNAGTFQFTPQALVQLNTLEKTFSNDFTLVTDITNYGAAVSNWALNEDQRSNYNLPPLPYPAPSQDVSALAISLGLSLTPIAFTSAPPFIAVPAEAFLTPDGYLAVIGVQQTPSVFLCLNGDTVPDGTKVTDPHGVSYIKHSVITPFGPENWYSPA